MLSEMAAAEVVKLDIPKEPGGASVCGWMALAAESKCNIFSLSLRKRAGLALACLI